MNSEELKLLEELEIDESELELISKTRNSKFDFPVIGISQQAVFFNRYAVDMVPPRIKWFTTSEYVIGIPAARDDRDGYITRKVWNEVVVHFPVPLRKQKKIKPGHYKLYKYKDGFAFKRYEQLEEPV